MITEDQLEQLCIDWFKETGYQYANGYDIAPDGASPERADYRQILLTERLLSQLTVINPQLPEEALEYAISAVSQPETPILSKNNKLFHQYLLEGIKVEYKENGEDKVDYVRLIDFSSVANNQFLIVNQFTITGTKGNRRPDVLVFINGIPVAVIELKNPATENATIDSAFNQLLTYKEQIPDLFTFNEALVISDGFAAKVGSLTANKERFLPWRTVKDEDDKPVMEYHAIQLDFPEG